MNLEDYLAVKDLIAVTSILSSKVLPKFLFFIIMGKVFICKL